MDLGQIMRNVSAGVGDATAPQVAAPPVAPTPWETAGHALIPTVQDGVSGYSLPDIENPLTPDGKPNPMYIPPTVKDAMGKDTANPHYTEARAVHDAFTAMDKSHRENNPNIDFAKQYGDLMAEQQANAEAAKKPRGNALSAFAIGLGAGPAGQAAYAKTNQAASETEADARDKALQFKKALVDAHVKQLVEQGNWKQALAQNEISTNLDRLLKESDTQRAHLNRMEENKQLIAGRQGVADTQAQGRIASTRIRAEAIAHQHGVPDKLMNAFLAKAGQKIAEQSDLIPDPDAWEARMPIMYDELGKIADQVKQMSTPDAAPAPGAKKGKMVQMYMNGQPHGAPISPEDFKSRGGAQAAATHGYTFKMQ
jgi:hypothetical protein